MINWFLTRKDHDLCGDVQVTPNCYTYRIVDSKAIAKVQKTGDEFVVTTKRGEKFELDFAYIDPHFDKDRVRMWNWLKERAGSP